ncbi:MAG TPA: hypothetical protein VM032_00845 [Vicinamibacterales bacterium]|nr:hypothetical protein [Vicinamibacterales bacterium]
MATTTTAFWALFLAGAAGHVDVLAAAAGRVVVHVADYQGVEPRELTEAEQFATDVYARIGVPLDWTGGNAGLAAPDGLLHVDLIILNAQMTAQHGTDPSAFGLASHRTRRAYVYYPRIAGYSAATRSYPARALAMVMAHELGHVLLPEHSHAKSGLMQATWSGQIRRIPAFLPSQAETIRSMVETWR